MPGRPTGTDGETVGTVGMPVEAASGAPVMAEISGTGMVGMGSMPGIPGMAGAPGTADTGGTVAGMVGIGGNPPGAVAETGGNIGAVGVAIGTPAVGGYVA